MMIKINILRAILLILSASLYHPLARAEVAHQWPLWQGFQNQFISDSGRVIDPYKNKNITTSEGQSYAMFFALVNDQPQLFAQLLAWTEANLAQGDLSKNLPAWLWGQNPQGKWEVLDDNSASDSDLWIIYNLIEAARLWHKPEYLVLANQMGELVMAKEVIEVPGIGTTLLPAAKGFYQENKSVRLNPSYLPMQVLIRLAKAFDNEKWQQLVYASYRLIITSSPNGFAPDWVVFDFENGFDFSDAIGSYNAIRVYLWAGMLANDDDYHEKLTIHFEPVLTFLKEHQHPPLEVNLTNNENQGRGGVGFSAALLPLASRDPQGHIMKKLLSDISYCSDTHSNHYYDQVLTLFACGWYENRFLFLDDGRLQTAVNQQ